MVLSEIQDYETKILSVYIIFSKLYIYIFC